MSPASRCAWSWTVSRRRAARRCSSQARLGGQTRRPSAAGARARAARPRRHVRRRAHRTRLSRRPCRRAVLPQRRLQHDVRARHPRGHDHRARARPAAAGRRCGARSSTTRRPGPFGRGRRSSGTGRQGRQGRRQAGGDDDAIRVERVSFVNVPSFVLYAGLPIQLGARHLRADVAYGGAFYAIVDSEAVGLAIDAAHLPELRRAGMAIKRAIESTPPGGPSARAVGHRH